MNKILICFLSVFLFSVSNATTDRVISAPTGGSVVLKGTNIKAKNTSGVDLFSIDGVTGTSIFGLTSGTATGTATFNTYGGNLRINRRDSLSSLIDFYNQGLPIGFLGANTSNAFMSYASNGSTIVGLASQAGQWSFPINTQHKFGSSSGGDSSTVVEIAAPTNRYPYIYFTENGTLKWSMYNDHNTDNFYFADGNGGHGVYLTYDGASGWTNFSDMRLKENIVPIKDAIKSVSMVDTFAYNLKIGSKTTYGVSAQSVLKAGITHAVDQSNPEKLGVAYDALIPWALAAIKEQQAQINCLVNAETKAERKICVGSK